MEKFLLYLIKYRKVNFTKIAGPFVIFISNKNAFTVVTSVYYLKCGLVCNVSKFALSQLFSQIKLWKFAFLIRQRNSYDVDMLLFPKLTKSKDYKRCNVQTKLGPLYHITLGSTLRSLRSMVLARVSK